MVVIGLATHTLGIEPFRLVGSELRVLGSIIYDDDDFVRALRCFAIAISTWTC